MTANPDALFVEAVHTHHAGALDDAARLYAQVLAVRPTHADSLHLLGVLAHQKGRADVAVGAIGQAIAINPLAASYHADLGHALRALGRLEEAAASYRDALNLAPDKPEVLRALAETLAGQGNLAAAEACYRRILAMDPDNPGVHINLGNALRNQGRLEAAVACYRTALRLTPDHAEGHANLAAALAEWDRPDAAAEAYRTALRLKPDFAEALNNFGNLLRQQGQPEAAVACYRRAIALKPDFEDAHFHLALALLAQGALAEGWLEHEWRWRTPQMRWARRTFAQPAWRGEPAAGRTLLLYTEQGFGDALQFCRYASLAAAAGLRVILEAPAPLVRLFGSLAGVDVVFPQGAPAPPFELQSSVMSLPLAFGTTLETIPDTNPYLHADTAQAAAWNRRLEALPTGLLRVGLAWSGNPRPEAPHLAAVDRRRSIAPALLAPVTAVPGVSFFSLQKDGPRAPASLGLTDFMAEMADFADTAALIANLDLVIAVDSALAHLAAALGKPVWLLDRFDSCWRWLTGRRDSPWYPTLRIYRQARPGDWDGVIAEVTRDLVVLRDRNRDLRQPVLNRIAAT